MNNSYYKISQCGFFPCAFSFLAYGAYLLEPCRVTVACWEMLDQYGGSCIHRDMKLGPQGLRVVTDSR